MFAAAIALASCLMWSGHSSSNMASQRVDLIELNHSYDDSGRHVFDQLVFYRWSAQRSMYRVIAWRMIKRDEQLPVKVASGYRCLWHDDGILREVWAPAYRETWSQRDPERENRRLFSEAHRPELAQPPILQKQIIRR